MTCLNTECGKLLKATKMTDEKKLEDLTPEEQKNLKVIFAPGCFDSFEGTQEELDGLIAEIQRMVSSGELFENSQPLDLEALDEEDAELVEKIFNNLDDTADKRNLQ